MRKEYCVGGIIELSGGWLDPLRFCVPAEDPRKEHAVWYSDTRVCSGGAAIERATCSVGLRNGATTLHCHGLWRTATGELLGGHLLPDDNLIAQPVAVTALLAADAWFERRFDEETNFELFAVIGGGTGKGVIATIRPNEDITEAIERMARAAGISKASVHGVGSLIDMSLTDGRIAQSLALEVSITGGRIVPHGEGITVVDLSMAGVGMDGVPYEGLLRRGHNRVCVTFELALDTEDS
jgi:predicted DNA-binding protein with PD1-like motif